MILKGQNLRLLLFDATSEKFKCVAMATTSTVNLNTNTSDINTKDDVDLASRPKVMSKSWQGTVDSIDVSDMGAMLTAIKNMQPFTVLFDETSTTNNQQPLQASFARTGLAYLSDATFTFNDRTISTKSLQFSGTGELSTVTSTPTYQVVSGASYTMGQNVRLLIGPDSRTNPDRVVGYAKQLSLHISVQLEDATTKETTGDWIVQTPTGISYDITSQALVRGADVITSSVQARGLSELETIYNTADPVTWTIANMTGDNNRTIDSTIISGVAIIQSLSINNPNLADSTFTANLSGYGVYAVAA